MTKSLSLSLVSIYLESWRFHKGFLKGQSLFEGKPGSQRQNSGVGIRMWCRAVQYCWSCCACLISCPQFLLSSQAFLRLMSTPLDVEYDKPSAPHHSLHPNPIYGLNSHLAKMYMFKILSPVHHMKWWHLCTKILEDLTVVSPNLKKNESYCKIHRYHGTRNQGQQGHIVWQLHWNGRILAAKIHQETRTSCTFDMRATVRFIGVREKEDRGPLFGTITLECCIGSQHKPRNKDIMHPWQPEDK